MSLSAALPMLPTVNRCGTCLLRLLRLLPARCVPLARANSALLSAAPASQHSLIGPLQTRELLVVALVGAINYTFYGSLVAGSPITTYTFLQQSRSTCFVQTEATPIICPGSLGVSAFSRSIPKGFDAESGGAIMARHGVYLVSGVMPCLLLNKVSLHRA